MKAITGNTYPVKEELKSLGGKWDANRKAWLVPDDKFIEAERLVLGSSKRKPYHQGKFSRRSFYRCPQCGNKADGGPGAPGYMCGEPCGS